MKITIDIGSDQAIALLSVAALRDEGLRERNVKKPQIKQIITDQIMSVIQDAGMWSDDVEELKAAKINGWAVAQVSRYTI